MAGWQELRNDYYYLYIHLFLSFSFYDTISPASFLGTVWFSSRGVLSEAGWGMVKPETPAPPGRMFSHTAFHLRSELDCYKAPRNHSFTWTLRNPGHDDEIGDRARPLHEGTPLSPMAVTTPLTLYYVDTSNHFTSRNAIKDTLYWAHYYNLFANIQSPISVKLHIIQHTP